MFRETEARPPRRGRDPAPLQPRPSRNRIGRSMTVRIPRMQMIMIRISVSIGQSPAGSQSLPVSCLQLSCGGLSAAFGARSFGGRACSMRPGAWPPRPVLSCVRAVPIAPTSQPLRIFRVARMFRAGRMFRGAQPFAGARIFAAGQPFGLARPFASARPFVSVRPFGGAPILLHAVAWSCALHPPGLRARWPELPRSRFPAVDRGSRDSRASRRPASPPRRARPPAAGAA